MENSTPNSGPEKKVSAKSIVPAKDIERSNLGFTVGTYWATRPTITLEYITQVQFLAIATAHQQAVKDRIDANKTRPQITKRLNDLDKEINSSTTYIKDYIADKYGKENAQSYFAEFGIIKKGKNWNIPSDRDKRVISLDNLLKALTKHDMETRNYGKAWWKPRVVEYLELVKSAGDTDSTTSEKVGVKNSQKDMVVKVLTSLVFIIKGNYPETWKTELRTWGFQKEKF